jgi:hypothetical protein
MLANDAASLSNKSPCDATKEAKKKKWKSMMGLKMYTGSGTKKAEGTATSSGLVRGREVVYCEDDE